MAHSWELPNPWLGIPIVGPLVAALQADMQQVETDLGAVSAGASGTLASIPAASAASNRFYFATDQAVLYFSDGASWHRTGTPAGALADWHKSTPPTGWVIYDGSTITNTGIYVDLYAHLGGGTLPDMSGRVTVGYAASGGHTDVSTVGNNDGQAKANRRPKHRTSNALTGTYSGVTGNENQNHNHSSPTGAGFITQTGGGAGTGAQGFNFNAGDWQAEASTTQTENQAHNHNYSGSVTLGGSIGTNISNDALDTPSYIVVAKIAKL